MAEIKELKKPELARRDLVSNSDVRWCPGCGDYSILSQVQGVIPKLGIPREKIVFISGIGCSSRFPYYMNTYGFHSIHGRALTLATGLRATRPDLQVWVVTGDGDSLSIGGNHLLHALRRNIDVNILLFNNRIYGLTKGQYSPTSLVGHKTKSTPQGSIDYPINPICVALASECSFVARAVDSIPKHLSEILERAARHSGASFVEIYQNCNIFNDAAYEQVVARDVRKERTLVLEHGKPLIFGDQQNKGIRMKDAKLEVITLQNEEDKNSLLVHDELNPDPAVAYFMSRMDYPDFPVPLGVFRAIEKPTYEKMLNDQVRAAKAKAKPDLQAIVTGKETWQVQ
jgi:2-oxoglutarate ferredoxin oxidoreductase subunit beta